MAGTQALLRDVRGFRYHLERMGAVAHPKGPRSGSFVWYAAFSDPLDKAQVSFKWRMCQIADGLGWHFK